MEKSTRYAYEQAESMLRIQGILTTVFGSIGAFFGLILMALFGLALGAAYTDADAIGAFLLFAATVVFFLVPHIYLIVSGITLMRTPEPRTAKTLIIINLVIGVFWNFVLLVFAIISLTQSGDYERGYTREAR